MAGTGATCTGATPSAPTWCTGPSCRSHCTRSNMATGVSRGAAWSTTATRRVLVRPAPRPWSWPTRARAAASASPTVTIGAGPGPNMTGNPVVRHVGRDPRLLWHEPTKRWVMAVYDENAGARGIVFHSSPDLKTWTTREPHRWLLRMSRALRAGGRGGSRAPALGLVCGRRPVPAREIRRPPLRA